MADNLLDREKVGKAGFLKVPDTPKEAAKIYEMLEGLERSLYRYTFKNFDIGKSKLIEKIKNVFWHDAKDDFGDEFLKSFNDEGNSIARRFGYLSDEETRYKLGLYDNSIIDQPSGSASPIETARMLDRLNFELKPRMYNLGNLTNLYDDAYNRLSHGEMPDYAKMLDEDRVYRVYPLERQMQNALKASDKYRELYKRAFRDIQEAQLPYIADFDITNDRDRLIFGDEWSMDPPEYPSVVKRRTDNWLDILRDYYFNRDREK